MSAGAAGRPWGALWNPSSTRRIKIIEMGMFVTDFSGIAGQSIYVARISARGTPGSSVTPDADNADDFSSAPPSGAILDLADYTVLPTVSSPEILPGVVFGGTLTGSQSTGFKIPTTRGIVVPPSAGVAILQRLDEAFTGGSEVEFIFED